MACIENIYSNGNFGLLLIKKESTPCYVYHDAHAGGIYAYIQQRGIVIKTDAETREFTNFDDLDAFLDRTFDPPPRNNLYRNVRESFHSSQSLRTYEKIPM